MEEFVTKTRSYRICFKIKMDMNMIKVDLLQKKVDNSRKSQQAIRYLAFTC